MSSCNAVWTEVLDAVQVGQVTYSPAARVKMSAKAQQLDQHAMGSADTMAG